MSEQNKALIRRFFEDAFNFTGRGTHWGEFMGIPPTGKQCVVSGTMLVQIARGKVKES